MCKMKSFKLTNESPKASTAWSLSSCMSSVISGASYKIRRLTIVFSNLVGEIEKQK